MFILRLLIITATLLPNVSYCFQWSELSVQKEQLQQDLTKITLLGYYNWNGSRVSWPWAYVNYLEDMRRFDVMSYRCEAFGSHGKKTILSSNSGGLALWMNNGKTLAVNLITLRTALLTYNGTLRTAACYFGSLPVSIAEFPSLKQRQSNVALSKKVVEVTASNNGEWETTQIRITANESLQVYARAVGGDLNLRTKGNIYRIKNATRNYLSTTPSPGRSAGTITTYYADFSISGKQYKHGASTHSVIFDVEIN